MIRTLGREIQTLKRETLSRNDANTEETAPESRQTHAEETATDPVEAVRAKFNNERCSQPCIKRL